MDTNTLLRIIDNPIRRQILEMVARQEKYTLELSKEIKVSQQAVSKHLNALKQAGILNTYIEPSNQGPPRVYYTPVKHFWLSISFGPHVFETNVNEYTPQDIANAKKRIKERIEEDDAEDMINTLTNLMTELEREIEEIHNRSKELCLMKGLVLDRMEKIKGRR